MYVFFTFNTHVFFTYFLMKHIKFTYDTRIFHILPNRLDFTYCPKP